MQSCKAAPNAYSKRSEKSSLRGRDHDHVAGATHAIDGPIRAADRSIGATIAVEIGQQHGAAEAIILAGASDAGQVGARPQEAAEGQQPAGASTIGDQSIADVRVTIHVDVPTPDDQIIHTVAVDVSDTQTAGTLRILLWRAGKAIGAGLQKKTAGTACQSVCSAVGQQGGAGCVSDTRDSDDQIVEAVTVEVADGEGLTQIIVQEWTAGQVSFGQPPRRG